MDPETKQHIGARSTWLRLLYMILFAIIFGIAEFVVIVVAAVQWLFTLITGESNQRLRRLGGQLGAYLQEIVRYQTFDTDDRPFPFADWPASEAEGGVMDEPGPPPAPAPQ